jgi:hypothetical protein
VSGFAATGTTWPAVLLILATAGAGVLAWRRQAGDAARLALLAVALAALAVVATANITGGLSPYLMRWWWVVALTLWLAIGWCLAAAIKGFQARISWPAGIAVAGGGVALVALTLAAALHAPLPDQSVSDTIANLAPSTGRALPSGRRDLVVWNDPETLFVTGFGMFTALERRGFDVVVPASAGFGFGSLRTAPPTPYQGVVAVLGVPDPLVPPQPAPGSHLVARYDPLSVGERLEADRLDERIRAAMGSHAPHDALIVREIPLDQALLVMDGASPSDVSRLAALQARGSPYEVFFTPSGT